MASSKHKAAPAHVGAFHSTSHIDEAKGGKPKKLADPANSMPGTTSHTEEALGGKAKKPHAPAHVGPASTSRVDEALGK